MGKKLVDPNKLCMGCMEILEDTSVPCPKCKFLLSDYTQPANSMPPYEILNGKYLVGRVIGIGGFGITYVGWDFYKSKKVCIKEYFPKGVAERDSELSMSTEYSTYSMNVFTMHNQKAKYMNGLKGYIKEAENLSKFYMMPGIVSVRDFFYGNKTAYIIMEYIDGINLRQFAKACGGVIESYILFNMLKEVISALCAVHEAGIVHRDISPDNIMVDKEYHAKVIDFGAAKQCGNMQEKSIFLKHGYAPIEQYDRNGNQGPWTDVYSLCSTIYYLLTGVKLQKSYERVADDRTMPLSHFNIAIEKHRENAIMKGISVQIEDRYSSMAELYYDIYNEHIPLSKKKVRKNVQELAPTESIYKL